MNPLLGAIAIVVVAGTVVAISARDPRLAVLGLAAALIGSPAVADPVPDPLGLAARIVAAILAAYLLWIVTRERGRVRTSSATTGGSRIGWPAETLVAASAFLVGLAAHGLGAPALGSPMASGAGFAVAALAVTATMTGGDVVRVGIGSLLLLTGASLVRAGLGGTPGQLEDLVGAGLVVVIATALAVLAASARSDGGGGFEFSLEDHRRRRREPDAHRIEPRIGDLGR